MRKPLFAVLVVLLVLGITAPSAVAAPAFVGGGSDGCNSGDQKCSGVAQGQLIGTGGMAVVYVCSVVTNADVPNVNETGSRCRLKGVTTGLFYCVKAMDYEPGRARVRTAVCTDEGGDPLPVQSYQLCIRPGYFTSGGSTIEGTEQCFFALPN